MYAGGVPEQGYCQVSFIDYYADLATEREHQLTTAHGNQTTGLTNGTAANLAPEVEFSPNWAFSRRQMTFPFCC